MKNHAKIIASIVGLVGILFIWKCSTADKFDYVNECPNFGAYFDVAEIKAKLEYRKITQAEYDRTRELCQKFYEENPNMRQF